MIEQKVMIEQEEDEGISQFLSTYQWVTVGQLLDGYGLKLPDTCVLDIIREKSSFYYQMLRLPAINVLNGIIVEQTKSYQIFIQKLFVDYLVSGEADVEETLGSETRASLETARQQVVELSAKFEEAEAAREKLIVESQCELIAWVDGFKKAFKQISIEWQSELQQHTGEEIHLPLSACYSLFADAKGFEIQDKAWERFAKEVKLTLSLETKAILQNHLNTLQDLQKSFKHLIDHYGSGVFELRIDLNRFRKQFYHDIGHVQKLLVQLSDFKFDEVRDKQQRSALLFDAKIGADDDNGNSSQDL